MSEDELTFEQVLPIFMSGYIPEDFTHNVVVIYNEDDDVSNVMTPKQAYHHLYSLVRECGALYRDVIDELTMPRDSVVYYRAKCRITEIDNILASCSNQGIVENAVDARYYKLRPQLYSLKHHAAAIRRSQLAATRWLKDNNYG